LAILEPKWAKMVIFGCRLFVCDQTAGRSMTPLCRHLMQMILHAYNLFGPLEILMQIFFFGHFRAKMGQNGYFWLPSCFFWPNGLPLDDATLQAFDAGHAPCIQPLWAS
jgi:hypothetical protein